MRLGEVSPLWKMGESEWDLCRNRGRREYWCSGMSAHWSSKRTTRSASISSEVGSDSEVLDEDDMGVAAQLARADSEYFERSFMVSNASPGRS